ncbi:phosphatase PAP2 family protein [Hymenobacter siberiensis]|uniref:phosphatase PAP2 family protein n=1 Tax=Hymenobacter siberiensis TaxID=2848396 RepID=UPI001C1E2E25|nr:phosphatase PAP2 family protein [Hymenobacter siberiensis]
MRSFLITRFAAIILLIGAIHPVQAQVNPTRADTTEKYQNPGGVSSGVKTPFFKSKVFRALAIPAALITYGAITAQGDAGINRSAREFTQKQFRPVSTGFDNTLIIAPYFELAAVAIAGVESHNDRINTLLIIAKGEAIMLASTFAVKYLANETRPNGQDNLSFPSGHTAQAFLAASIVHTEFRDKSQWYGVGAYTIATSVAALRMINDKHWQSDVVAGAGFGIFSAHLAYLSHRNRWGRKSIGRDVGMVPAYFGNGATGISISWRPKK